MFKVYAEPRRNTSGQRGPLPANIKTQADYYNSGRGSRLGGSGRPVVVTGARGPIRPVAGRG